MAPTTVTTIAMVVFGLAVLAAGLRNLFGSWEPRARRVQPHDDVEVAVVELRRAIEDWERIERSR